MKNFRSIQLVTFLLFIAFSSCKKDSPADRTVVGFWKGKYTENNVQKDWSWLVRENMTLRVFIGGDTTTATKYEGSYSKTDTTITVSYTFGGNFGTTLKGNLNATYTKVNGADFVGNPFYLDK